jgi:phosphoribosylglycinamide formyltransferase-1
MLRVAVCISGNGSLVPSLLEEERKGKFKISCVVADRPHAPGLKNRWAQKVETLCIDRRVYSDGLSEAVLETLQPRADLIVLAGFLSILEGTILEEYEGRIINIHPALLPKFGGKGMYGMNVHRAVVSAGEKESGCTVHHVTAGIDSGPIILQRKVALTSHETPESVQKKVRQIESPTLIAAVNKLSDSLEAVSYNPVKVEGGC